MIYKALGCLPMKSYEVLFDSYQLSWIFWLLLLAITLDVSLKFYIYIYIYVCIFESITWWWSWGTSKWSCQWILVVSLNELQLGWIQISRSSILDDLKKYIYSEDGEELENTTRILLTCSIFKALRVYLRLLALVTFVWNFLSMIPVL